VPVARLGRLAVDNAYRGALVTRRLVAGIGDDHNTTIEAAIAAEILGALAAGTTVNPTESQNGQTVQKFLLPRRDCGLVAVEIGTFQGDGMDLHDGSSPQECFRAYAADLASVLGHADRVRPFEDYCVGLLSTEGRKSVEPLAATTAPERTAAQHQSLLHFVAQAPWSDRALLTRVREQVLASITSDEPIQAWIIDDTEFPKKGSHSVGVAREYCGQLGKQDNCQVAVSLSVATHQGSLPIAYRLYLPKDWAGDPLRRAIAGVPADVVFQTKPEIALQHLRQAVADDVPPGVALMDPAYGNDSKLRAGISQLGLTYMAGISPTTMLWRPGEAPLPPASSPGRGRPGRAARYSDRPCCPLGSICQQSSRRASTSPPSKALRFRAGKAAKDQLNATGQGAPKKSRSMATASPDPFGSVACLA
jgi:hypothetical protein